MAVQLKRLDPEIHLIVGYEDGRVALFRSVVDAWSSPRLDVNAGWTLTWSHKLHHEPGARLSSVRLLTRPVMGLGGADRVVWSVAADPVVARYDLEAVSLQARGPSHRARRARLWSGHRLRSRAGALVTPASRSSATVASSRRPAGTAGPSIAVRGAADRSACASTLRRPSARWPCSSITATASSPWPLRRSRVAAALPPARTDE